MSRGPASRFAGRAGPGLAPSALTRGFGGVSSCLGRGADGTAPLAFLRRVHLPAGLQSPLGGAVSGAWGSSGPLEGRGLCSLLWSRSAGASSTAEGHGRGRRGGRPDCFPTVSEQVSSSASRGGAAPGPGAAGSPGRKPLEMESCRSGEQRGGPWACCLGLWGPRAGVGVWGVGTVPLCSCWDPMSEPKSHGRKQEGLLQAARASQVTTPQPPTAVGTEADPSRTGPPRTAPTPTDPCALVVSSQGRSRRPPLEVPPGGTPISPLCARRTGTRWQDDACALFPWQEAARPTACPGDASRPRAPGPLGPHLSVILNQSPASPTAGWGPLAPRPHILGP